jgi:hypothetical protein
MNSLMNFRVVCTRSSIASLLAAIATGVSPIALDLSASAFQAGEGLAAPLSSCRATHF